MESFFHFFNKKILTIVLVYVLVSCLWIVVSDSLLYWITSDPELIQKLSITKGWFFIGVTAVLLYGMISRYSAVIEKSEALLREQNLELVHSAAELNYQLEQKQLQEQRLLESEERFRRAIMYAPLPVMIHLEDGEVQLISKSWTEITGYKPEDIPNVNQWLKKAYRRQHQEIKSAIDALYQLNERVDEGEFKIFTAQGQIRHWAFSSAPLGRLSDGRRAVISMAMDVTERKLMENELRERNRELDQFAYVVSHDLKAPLRAIDSLSSWIEEDLQGNMTPAVSEHIGLMRNRVQRMQEMIQGILEYSRVGRVQSQMAECNVKNLLEEIISDLSLPEDFTVSIGEGMPVLHTEVLRLRQVFSNLIDNAVKHHNKQEGRIEINVKEEETLYVFSVTDDGPGISEAYHSRIFELFQVLQPRDVKENTGVGLALVKKIVETQNGQIQVSSQVGFGTTFTFTWPK